MEAVNRNWLSCYLVALARLRPASVLCTACGLSQYFTVAFLKRKKNRIMLLEGRGCLRAHGTTGGQQPHGTTGIRWALAILVSPSTSTSPPPPANAGLHGYWLRRRKGMVTNPSSHRFLTPNTTIMTTYILPPCACKRRRALASMIHLLPDVGARTHTRQENASL